MSTKKDFTAMANLISEAMLHADHRATATWMALQLADKYARENPRFNRAKFLQACGVSE